MKIHNAIQGTQEWLDLRSNYFTASEAPAMMGASKYQSRQDLLKQKATGETKPVSGAQQALFNKGHAAEASIRPHVEEIIGESLFPVTGSSEEHHGLLASFDGRTMIGDIVFEHKLWNESLAENIRNGIFDDHYAYQLEQQILVSEAEKAIFVVSDGTPEKMVYAWYCPQKGYADALLAGWKQFAEDLANYKPEAKTEVIEAQQDIHLPVPVASVDGSIVVSNIADCLPAIRKFAQEETGKQLETDLDFVNKESVIKAVKSARDKIKTLTESTIANFETLQAFKEAMAEADALLQQVQSHGEKQLKTRKEEIKKEVIVNAQIELSNHITAINKRLGLVAIPPVNPDFTGAVKGKRNLDSMKDAVAGELANAKIEANRHAVAIEENLKVLEIEAEGYEFLFNDLQQIINKEHGDFVTLIKFRVSEHKQAEEKRKAQEDANRIALECARASQTNEPEEVKPQAEVAQTNGYASAQNVDTTTERVKDNRSREEIDIACWFFSNADVTQHQAGWIATQLVSGRVPHIQINNAKAA